MAPLSQNGNMNYELNQASIQPLLTVPNYKTLLNNCLECVLLCLWETHIPPLLRMLTADLAPYHPVLIVPRVPCQAYEGSSFLVNEP